MKKGDYMGYKEPKWEKAKQVTSVGMFERLVPTTKYWKWNDKTTLTGQLLNLTYRRLKVEIDRGNVWTVRPYTGKTK